MSYFAGNAKIKTATLLACTLTALSCLIIIATHLIDNEYGYFLRIAMIDASPGSFEMASIVKSDDDSYTLQAFEIYAPYLLMGYLIGYLWPLRDTRFVKLIGKVLLRFVMVWVPMVSWEAWQILLLAAS